MHVRMFFIPFIIVVLLATSSVLVEADGVTKRIRFAKGKSSATVRGAVIRGETDTYIVGARAEQMMSVSVSSLENNAVFTLQGPDGDYLQDAGEEDDARGVTVSLPYNGDYRIKVSGTRGNATYRLTVAIR
ncbi:MAG TPA: hypothetical protein PKD26_14580 [Pyrinomonadaceae bacterium]|nr:hypothetical protein [Pyrinomonadaceae bacterium]